MSLTAKLLHRALLLALLWPWSPGVAETSSDLWTSIGPKGGQVVAFAIDPSNHKTIYAGRRAAGS